MRHTGFNDAMWGKATRSYVKSAHLLSNVKFNAIVQSRPTICDPEAQIVFATRLQRLRKSSVLMMTMMMNRHTLFITLTRMKSVSCFFFTFHDFANMIFRIWLTVCLLLYVPCRKSPHQL